jgi:MYXO-CTERM domain-containing protein
VSDAVFGCAKGGQPNDLIIGSPPYSNANSSITNTHMPSIESGAFDLTLTGFSGSPTVTGVTFEFGTGPELDLPGVSVPGPTAGAGLPGLGLAGIGLFIGWRRRRWAGA